MGLRLSGARRTAVWEPMQAIQMVQKGKGHLATRHR